MNSVVVQYDFLKTKEESWKEEIEKNIISVKTSSDKVRRGMYAKLGDLQKKKHGTRAEAFYLRKIYLHRKLK